MAVRILIGDCMERLLDIPEKSVQCVVTSPPYYGLRSYLPAAHPDKGKEIGQERGHGLYVQNIVEVFRRLRPCLRDDATAWLNIGDVYGPGKQLMLLPSRVAIALQDDGWIVRQQIAWVKPAPMPENVKDRPTSAWEAVFLISKTAQYYYDQDAIREPAKTTAEQAKTKWKGRRMEQDKGHAEGVYHGGGKPFASDPNPLGRNAHNVWTVSQETFVGAHFAVMAPGVAERCIKAGSRPGDMVLDPFGGAGTTAIAADRLQREATMIELNPDYAKLAQDRLHGESPLFARTLLDCA